MSHLGAYSSAAFTSGSGLAVGANAQVTVRREDTGALAQLFSDVDGSPIDALVNPFNADASGRFEFFAAELNLGYRVTVTSGVESWELRHQCVNSGYWADLDDSTGASRIGFKAQGAAAVATDLEEKNRRRFELLDFIPDNLKSSVADRTITTDLTQYLQDAIDEIKTYGGAIELPRGRVPLEGFVLIDESNVTIFGHGDECEIYIPTWITNAVAPAFIQAYNAAKNLGNIHFRHFRVLSTYSMTSTIGNAASALMIGGALDTVTVNDSGYFGITIEKVAGVALNFNGGSNNAAGGVQCFNNYALGNNITNCGQTGINAASGGHSNTLVSGNRMRKLGGYGVEWSSRPATISFNVMQDTQNSGIITEGATTQDGWIDLLGNVITRAGNMNGGNVSPAIQLGEAIAAQKIRATKNIIRKAYGQGIIVQGATQEDIVVTDNEVDEFGIGGDTRTLGAPGSSWAGINTANVTRCRTLRNHVRAGTAAGDRCDYGFLTGGSGGVDTLTDKNTTLGAFDVAPFISSSSAGANGIGTRNRVGRNQDLTTGKYHIGCDASNNENIPYFTDLDTTPSVAGSDDWRVFNSPGSPNTTITTFDDGYIGQKITLYFYDANTSISETDNIKLSAAFTSSAGDSMTLGFDGTSWMEIARSVN